MTIKRRLFISNILMLIIPVILSVIMVGSMIFIYTEVKGNHDFDGNFGGNEQQFYDYIKKINEFMDKWGFQNNNLDKKKTDVKYFNEKNKNNEIFLCLYKGKQLLSPSIPPSNNSILNTALSMNGNHTYIIDNIAIYRCNVGVYTVILTDSNFKRYDSDIFEKHRESLFLLGIIILLFVIGIIFLTNRFLTEFVFKSIITPMDTLVYGVRQIRDGNLDYHIEYSGNDEFTDVCSDFNEMAHRLLTSVNERQRDENNRRELIAGISHDLRTPLTSIKAYVEGIEKGVAATPEAQKRYLDIIKNKTMDLEHIVKQLFLFSKLDIGEFPIYMETVDIGKELNTMITALSEEYEKKGLSVLLEQNIQNVYVQADIVQLRNAVINVLENSVKYKNKKKGKMEIYCREEDKYVNITLKDDGPGVEGKAIDRLFDIFYRSDPSRTNPSKGSGLGLSITAKILERLGGSIRAENAPEGGLSVIMMLPRHTGGDAIEKNINH